MVNHYTLRSWDGLVQKKIAIEPFRAFPLTQLDYYDFVVFKVAGVDLRDDLVPVQLEAFPISGTHLVHLSYIFDNRHPKQGEWHDFNNDPNNDEDIQDLPIDEALPVKDPPLAEDPQIVEDLPLAEDPQIVEDLPLAEDPQIVEDFPLAEDPQIVEDLPLAEDINTNLLPQEMSSSLYWRRCQAGMIDQAMRVGTFDCLPYRDVLQGSWLSMHKQVQLWVFISIVL